MSSAPLGVWLVGARGCLATTVVVGAKAVAAGLAPSIGLVTSSPEAHSVPFESLNSLVFGGHEIRPGSLEQSARQINQVNRSLHEDWIAALHSSLEATDRAIRPGLAMGCGPAIEALANGSVPPESQIGALARIRADLREFRDRNQVERLVVVNLASTEPPIAPDDLRYQSLSRLLECIEKQPAGSLRPGALYAAAACLEDAAFINFTPSNSPLCPAVRELADQRGLPYFGNDGKTGETLVKSVLAPMFAYRALCVDSWVGFNILGNRDGQVLASPANKQSKILAKGNLLPSILGPDIHTHVGIEFVPSINDNKVAWDFIHFRGFLGHSMSMQFTWQGCDSVLAAPLVLDLVRFAGLALSLGESGPMVHLGSFFKSPLDSADHNLHVQFEELRRYLTAHRNPGVPPANRHPDPVIS